MGVYIETNRLTFHKWMEDWYKNQQDLKTDQDPLIIFNFFVKNAYLTPWKNFSKFTRISRTVWTFAKKTEIMSKYWKLSPMLTCCWHIKYTMIYNFRKLFYLYNKIRTFFYPDNSVWNIRSQYFINYSGTVVLLL